MSAETNAVRQVLMNELGLTRDSVREIMTEIVRDVIEKHFNSGGIQKLQESVVEGAVRRCVGTWDNSTTDKMLREEFAKALRNQIANRARALFEQFDVSVVSRGTIGAQSNPRDEEDG
jgi:hypothetical protein